MFAYVNGSYVPAGEASISIYDRGFMLGDAVFDTTRTFDGTAFRLEAHLARLTRSLKYIEIDPERVIRQAMRATEEMIYRNQSAINQEGDIYVTQIVTRGSDLMPGSYSPTVIVMPRKIDFGFGTLYDAGGVELAVSLNTAHFSGAVDPRIKSTNRLGLVRGELKATRQSMRSGGFVKTIQFNSDGSIAETNGANLSFVKNGSLVRPPRRTILNGISLQTLEELARAAGMDIQERTLTIYDLLDADETLITATSFSVLPVVDIDGISLPGGGPAYRRLLQDWIELVSFDFVAQARERCKMAER